MFKLPIEVYFENYFGLIDSRYILIARVDEIRILFLGHPVQYIAWYGLFEALVPRVYENTTLWKNSK